MRQGHQHAVAARRKALPTQAAPVPLHLTRVLVRSCQLRHKYSEASPCDRHTESEAGEQQR